MADALPGTERCLQMCAGWMDGWMDDWMDGWLAGWLAGWLDGWMDGWMDDTETTVGYQRRGIKGRNKLYPQTLHS